MGLSGITSAASKVKSHVHRRTPVGQQAETKHRSFAVLTPTVNHIMENFFKQQIEPLSHIKRVPNCNKCPGCLTPDCKSCINCLDKPKYGGPGIRKQRCIYRVCENATTRDNKNEGEKQKCVACGEQRNEKARPLKFQRWDSDCTEVSESDSTPARKYYRSAVLSTAGDDSTTCVVGDAVQIDPETENSPQYFIILALFQLGGKQLMHGRLFDLASHSALCEAAHEHELFLMPGCVTLPINTIQTKIELSYMPPSPNWKNDGDIDTVATYGNFFWRLVWDAAHARFVAPDPQELPPYVCSDNHAFCLACTLPILSEDVKGSKDETGDGYVGVQLKGVDYYLNDCAFFLPSVWEFQLKFPKQQLDPINTDAEREADPTVYPEMFRKKTTAHSKVGGRSSLPYRVGRIVGVRRAKGSGSHRFLVRVRKFYRPEDTHLSEGETIGENFCRLHASEEEAEIDAKEIRGKCTVYYKDDVTCDLDSLVYKENCFYYDSMYDPETEKFSACKRLVKTPPMESEPKVMPLKCLDIFAGCGGLSAGLHEAGIAACNWGIEFEPVAAAAFQLNNPDAHVYAEDCNSLLKMVMQRDKGEKNVDDKHKDLPKRGEVDIIVGGPPCQGYSGMNRFSSGTYSKFKNSLVATYLSYLDYYRPRYFILENVRNFLFYKKQSVLKLALRLLIEARYSVTFGILQAAHYGVPQTRRRTIIIACAPGETLPKFPTPRFMFSKIGQDFNSYFMVGKTRFCTLSDPCAPFRRVTVRDAISDLPQPNTNGSPLAYLSEPLSHFQRLLRKGRNSVSDQVSKPCPPLIHARIERIPIEPGADWRDLPNIVVQLEDGTSAELLKYEFNDYKHGKGPEGQLRGVCNCATSPKAMCTEGDHQLYTLIPWCLPHTSSRHNNWAGLYGRLDLDGIFNTTVTVPEPMGKQGKVLHPTQHRLVSVRECARSQGFADAYKFNGTILERYKQVGNAVPPPLAHFIGLEIRKCLAGKAVQ
eukprot:TRINITY_DN671_c0_g3_i3.p1 TRINITY_DN671_c0_g3~~TRINITY_DN671_c0_g3_i3.p1  ORF type:complete len:986 (+),score=214.26 TRINITY_DN671_c0_g3_i3:1376-4333(+)